MTLLLVFISALLLFIFGSMLLAMFAFRQARTTAEVTSASTKPLSFRWKSVLLPVIVLLLVVGMCAWFYGRLPAEVASRFADDGTPSAFTSRGALIMWAILPQLLLTLLALMVAWGMTRIGALLRSSEESGVRLESLLFVMANMVVLPQLILGFAMLNTFSYNAYQLRIVPLWAVVIIVVIAGAVILGAFFISTIRKVWIQGNK